MLENDRGGVFRGYFSFAYGEKCCGGKASPFLSAVHKKTALPLTKPGRKCIIKAQKGTADRRFARSFDYRIAAALWAEGRLFLFVIGYFPRNGERVVGHDSQKRE